MFADPSTVVGPQKLIIMGVIKGPEPRTLLAKAPIFRSGLAIPVAHSAGEKKVSANKGIGL